ATDRAGGDRAHHGRKPARAAVGQHHGGVGDRDGSGGGAGAVLPAPDRVGPDGRSGEGVVFLPPRYAGEGRGGGRKHEAPTRLAPSPTLPRFAGEGIFLQTASSQGRDSRVAQAITPTIE